MMVQRADRVFLKGHFDRHHTAAVRQNAPRDAFACLLDLGSFSESKHALIRPAVS